MITVRVRTTYKGQVGVHEFKHYEKALLSGEGLAITLVPTSEVMAIPFERLRSKVISGGDAVQIKEATK